MGSAQQEDLYIESISNVVIRESRLVTHEYDVFQQVGKIERRA